MGRRAARHSGDREGNLGVLPRVRPLQYAAPSATVGALPPRSSAVAHRPC